jgi:hypothetical protein
MNEILVHNNWDPLEEIWVGDVWPAHFYDDIKDSRIRDAFYQVTEWTKEDLTKLQKKFEEFGVTVRRPYVDGNKSSYLDKNPNSVSFGKLLKPPITPRDHNAVVGDKLFFSDGNLGAAYAPLLDLYDHTKIFNGTPRQGYHFPYKGLSGASTVKIGKDLIFDVFLADEELVKKATPEQIKQFVFVRFFDILNLTFPFFEKDYRIQLGINGGHCDGCFMPVRPGLLLTTNYWSDYERSFPGWDRLHLGHPTYRTHRRGMNGNQRWRLSHLPSPNHFNEYLEAYCPEWIGNFTETVFEANVVMIDEKNMVCNGVNEPFFEELERWGVTPHVVPFRTRTFWDGGIHCITLDIRRKSTLKDYFPERGDPGLHSILDGGLFDNSIDKFLSEYQAWCKTQTDLPSKITDLSAFVNLNREKLKVVIDQIMGNS